MRDVRDQLATSGYECDLPVWKKMRPGIIRVNINESLPSATVLAQLWLSGQ